METADEYLVVLSGHNVFREVELSSSSSVVRIGTTTRCDVRFRKELFFSPVEIELAKNGRGEWTASCSEDVYFAENNVKKLAVQGLKHGDELVVKYVVSGATIFTMTFLVDFERRRGAYDRYVDVSRLDSFTIGGKPNCNIVLSGPYTADDLLAFERSGSGFTMRTLSSSYGALFDGLRVTGSVDVVDMSFISIADFYFYYKEGKLYFSSRADVSFNGLVGVDLPANCPTSDYPRFNRNTRIKKVQDEEKISLLKPPMKPEPPQGNIILQLLPAVGMLAVTVLLRGTIMSSMSSGGFIIISAATISIGILTSVLGIVDDKRKYKKKIAEREETYKAYIDQKREEVEAAREDERAALQEKYPSVSEQIVRVEKFSGELFDRRPADDDFLHVRMGLGSRESVKKFDYTSREEFDSDELSQIPDQLVEQYRFIEESPIVVDFNTANAVGLVGSPDRRELMLRDLVVDLCTRHYKDDMQMFFVVEPENESHIHWARVLPHVQSAEMGCRNIACDEESKNVVFEYLFKVLSSRAADEKASRIPHLMIFVLDECGLKNHPLSRFIDNAAELGATFLFFEEHKEHLPMGCGQIITLDDEGLTGFAVPSEDGTKVLSFAYEAVDEAKVAAAATKLAPVYCEEVSLEGSLTKSISLFELLGIIAADDLDLSKRWASTRVEKSLAAPLGVTKTHVINLDLHDKAHGPHGLVAGTTGSGKSEILQTYILSMATLFHPYEVGFVIIDFKGGGMVNQFRDLPHLMGAITNIDGREIERSLKSIKAELRRRQQYFADAGVNHINNYIKKFKAGEVPEPLPHLIIVVDEFAELKAEQPEFMAELISASRIGRSLGVHLILATQKPSGQVNEQIWSNSRFKLCLKVQSKEDSNEMLKSPLAAEIKEPGRAYLQVGNNEIFELFQSGFSGAPEHQNEDDTREFSLYQVENSGKRVPVFEKKRKKSDEASATQLEAVVGHVADYCKHNNIDRLPSICLPPLSDLIVSPETPIFRDGMLALGVYDDPDTQYQGEAFFDVAGSNIFVVGSSQMGKTNLLQLIIRSVAVEFSPREAQIYIMDFSSMVLKNFEDLNHVGGVVLPSEDEKLKNLFKLLSREMTQRKRRLLEAGVSSYASYVEAGNDDMPHLYVLMDNFAVFRELYGEAFGDALLTLCRDGISYGISIIIANSSSAGFGYRYLSNFSTCIALTCNDTSEYGIVFDRCRVEPKAVAGRALCSIDKNLYELQTYLAFEGEREVDRVAAMRSFVEKCNGHFSGQHAKLIPSVPDDLGLDYIRQNYSVASNQMALALDYGTVEPSLIDLDSQFSVALVGKDKAAKLRFVDALMADVRENVFDRPAEVIVIDGLMRELSSYSDAPYVASYYGDYTEIDVVMERVRDSLAARYAAVADEGITALADEPYLIVVVNSQEAIDHISANKQTMAMFEEMKRKFSAMRVLFVFGDVADAAVPFSGPALLKLLKEDRKCFVFSNFADLKFLDLSVTVTRSFKGPLEAGQAYRIDGADVSKVMIARA